jgi:hypothetical protein
MAQDVDKILRCIEYGATEPFEGTIQGTHVFIKTFNNRWSNKILINEYICLKLGKLLGLPIPDGGVCCITDQTDISNVEPDLDYDEHITGKGFYSKRIERSTKFIRSHSIVSNIENKYDINKIILFDHLIYNNDRHEGNLMFSMGGDIKGYRMHIIDHSHVFNLHYTWNAVKIQQLIHDEDYNDTKILRCNYHETYEVFNELNIITRTDLENEIILFKSRIDEEILRGIVKDIPEEWITDINDIEKLIDYIMYRLYNLDNMKEMIINYLEEPGGV